MPAITIDQLELSHELTARLKHEVGEMLGDLLGKSWDDLRGAGFTTRELDEVETALRESNLYLKPPYR